MKTQFEKIYVVSLITNKDRQEFIKYQFNEVDLDFEFIYGIDYYNFKNISFPDAYINTEHNSYGTSKDYGCTIGHYSAVMQAYYLGYNNVLIFEDDVCLNKDLTVLYDMLNNVPEDANFVDFDPRQCDENYQQELLQTINNTNKRYLKLMYEFRGAAMYALMNRDMMKLYLDSQHKCFKMSDNVDNFFENKQIESYIPTKCLFVDQHTYNKYYINNNKTFEGCYDNMYTKLNKYTKDSFFEPHTISEWTR